MSMHPWLVRFSCSGIMMSSKSLIICSACTAYRAPNQTSSPAIHDCSLYVQLSFLFDQVVRERAGQGTSHMRTLAAAVQRAGSASCAAHRRLHSAPQGAPPPACPPTGRIPACHSPQSCTSGCQCSFTCCSQCWHSVLPHLLKRQDVAGVQESQQHGNTLKR